MAERTLSIGALVCCLSLAMGVALGCSDATAASRAFAVTLSPELVRTSSPDSIQMRVSVRNGGSNDVRLAFERAIAEVETTPGVWQRVAGGEALYNITMTNIDIPPSTERVLVGGLVPLYDIPDIRYMPAGRYRLVIRYVPLNASRSEPPPSSYVESYSNVMVIVP